MVFIMTLLETDPFTTSDLSKIEKKMIEIINRGEKFTREVWSRDKALKFFTKREKYKAELINDLPKDETITIYKQGQWLDYVKDLICLQPNHIGKAFKLMKVAGAYWRGDSNKTMLTRIYGTAWRNEKELNELFTTIRRSRKKRS